MSTNGNGVDQISTTEALLHASIANVQARRAGANPDKNTPAATTPDTQAGNGEQNLTTLSPVIEIDRPRPHRYTPDQIDLIRRTIARKATDDELELFVHLCERSGLDPFARQIYCMKRREWSFDDNDYVERMSVEASIDGLRLCAERTGKYVGQEDPLWCGPDGVWKDVWLEKAPPVAARVGVLRSDFRQPLRATALYSAYVQTKRDGSPTRMWVKMGASQLAKCAEALAFRKAFPRELSGLYAVEEMEQVDTGDSKADTPRKRAREERPTAAAAIAERKIEGMNAGKTYEQVSTDERARLEAAQEIRPIPKWCMKIATIREKFAEIEKRIPPPVYSDLLGQYRVDNAGQFRGPKDAWECYQVMEGWLEAAGNPSNYEHFESTEGAWQ